MPFVTLTMVMLTAGAAILRWLAQSVEDKGLGEGTSLLITLSIVTSKLLLVLMMAAAAVAVAAAAAAVAAAHCLQDCHK